MSFGVGFVVLLPVEMEAVGGGSVIGTDFELLGEVCSKPKVNSEVLLSAPGGPRGKELLVMDAVMSGMFPQQDKRARKGARLVRTSLCRVHRLEKGDNQMLKH